MRYPSTFAERKLRRACRVLGLGLALLLPGPLSASGPFLYSTPFTELHPSQDELLAGRLNPRLGASQPLELLLAWLQLSGRFSAAHAELFRAYQADLAEPGEPAYAGLYGFLEAARGEGVDIGYLPTGKVLQVSESVNGRTYTRSSYYENCQADAFSTALRTFEERRTRYGAGSPQLDRWLEAQIQVFGHCGDEGFYPPEDPQPGWQPLEIQDRRYQIAAAYFYANRYLEAAERFRAIASDPQSPWRNLARYLEARSLGREALINEREPERQLQAALALYQSMAENPALLAAFPSIPGQIRFLQAARDPLAAREATFRQLIDEPATADPQHLADYRYFLNRDSTRPSQLADLPATASPFTRWLTLVLSQEAGAGAAALAEWQDGGGLPWLLLAMEKADAATAPASLQALLAEAARVTTDSPGHFPVLLQRLRLYDLAGERAAALALGEQALANPDLDRNQVNQLRAQLARLAGDWESYLRWALMRALDLPWSDDFVRQLPAHFPRVTRDDSLLDAEASALVNAYLGPDKLLSALELQEASPYLRSRLAISGWLQALLLEDFALARRFVPALSALLPALADDFARFAQAEDPRFEAAWIALNHPGFSPFLSAGVGRVQELSRGEEWIPRPALDSVALPLAFENWWCPDASLAEWRPAPAQRGELETLLAGLAADDPQRARRLNRLGDVSVAAAFGPWITAQAGQRLDDPRLPQALHRVVFATRYACMGGPGAVSQAAFSLLHRHFPNSEWAQRTPYWYN